MILMVIIKTSLRLQQVVSAWILKSSNRTVLDYPRCITIASSVTEESGQQRKVLEGLISIKQDSDS